MDKNNGGCQRCVHQSCAKRVPIFSTLSPDEMGKVTDLIYRKQYVKGEFLFMEGSKLESLIFINKGQVKAFRNTQEGKEQILYIFSEGDFLGEKNILQHHTATYHVEALADTHICMIHKKDFQQLLRVFPDIGFKIMEELCNRLERLESIIESMGAKNVEARVNMVLVEFAKKYGKQHSKGILVDLPLSREGIANYIGLTRETVSRKMSLLQDEGIIEAVGNKKIIVKDPKALEASIE